MVKGTQKALKYLSLFTLAAGTLATSSLALTIDGNGHYSIRGETRTKPGMSGERGIHQAIDQSFRLLGEARVNEKSSFFLEFKLFDDPRNAYLGDSTLAKNCSQDDETCRPHQGVSQPRYRPLTPYVGKYYGRYAFDYFILEAGRRGRQWGLGIFLDAGEDPFSRSASVYDGVSFDINIQEAQNLGVSFGFDKISETGSYVNKGYQKDINFGPNNKHDDVDQLFLTVVYDDRKSNAGGSLTKQIGFYGARISSSAVEKGGDNTELTFVDLYTAFHFTNLSIKNEILLTLGKTADPNMIELGGAFEDKNGEPVTNKTNSIGLAGELNWTLASSGTYIGPRVYRQGDATRHVAFASYAFAPGDSEGYYDDARKLESNVAASDSKNLARTISKRSNKAKALGLHENYKPAMLMFNGRSQIDDLAVDGVFDPDRVMNAQVYSIGYRYEDLNLGNFEAKATYGRLNENLSDEDVLAYYKANPAEVRPIGYYGDSLGIELDLVYWTHFSKDLDLGVGGAILSPGDAWKVSEAKSPEIAYMLQSYINFNF